MDQANTVPLSILFRYYGLPLDEGNRKIICPIKTHQGGRESSASFYYYPDTNTFHCFGCKAGSRACDLVSLLDGTTRSKAALKILELFSSNIDTDLIFNVQNFSEQLSIMVDFSSYIRDFRQKHNDEHAYLFAEELCKMYDRLFLNTKKGATNESLARVIEHLKSIIDAYTPSIKL